MDPLDHVRVGLDGIACAVCEGPVPAESIHLLALRDALAFVQVECAGCRSTTLAFLLDGADGSKPGDAPAAGPPIDGDDVLDMHVLLRSWQGGLTDLLRGTDAGSGAR